MTGHVESLILTCPSFSTVAKLSLVAVDCVDGFVASEPVEDDCVGGGMVCTAPAGASANSLTSLVVKESLNLPPRDCSRTLAGPSKRKKSCSRQSAICPALQLPLDSPYHPKLSVEPTSAP